eukprot:COSAG05_NODE_22_length_32312_cov_23.410890_7_plen_57_part_00
MESGQLTLEWDNKSSFFKKTLLVRLLVVRPVKPINLTISQHAVLCSHILGWPRSDD